jgi:hypothetical protein
MARIAAPDFGMDGMMLVSGQEAGLPRVAGLAGAGFAP